MKYWRWNLALVTALTGAALLLAHCDPRQATTQDDWCATIPPPTGKPLPVSTWVALPPNDLHEVMPAMEAKAEEMLQAVPCVPLTESQAVELVGKPLPHHQGTKPY